MFSYISIPNLQCNSHAIFIEYIVQFGITFAVLRVILQPLINKLDPDQSGKVKKQRFMLFKQYLPDWVCYKQISPLPFLLANGVM